MSGEVALSADQVGAVSGTLSRFASGMRTPSHCVVPSVPGGSEVGTLLGQLVTEEMSTASSAAERAEQLSEHLDDVVENAQTADT